MAKILIAEDDKNLAKVLKINLESEGYEINLAHDGEETLARLKEIKPDLLLLDIMMPKLDGFQVAHAMKDDPELASIPIIVLTAKGSEEDIMKGWDAGAVDYFVKPFNLTRLLDVIGKQLHIPERKTISKKARLIKEEVINVALVGAEEAGISLLKFLLGNHKVNILGVADRNEQAEGLHLAQQMGLFTTTNIADIFNINNLSMVLATKNSSVLHLLQRDETVEILGEIGINFLETLVGENEEREHRERLLAQKLNTSVQKEKLLRNGFVDLFVSFIDDMVGLPGHTVLVRAVTRHLCVELKLPQEDMETLDLAAALHDIGKMFMPKEQARSVISLPSEVRKVKDLHPILGGDCLNLVPALKFLVPIVRAHHERWDGKGFPDGLSGNDIPFYARILAISDSCVHMFREGKPQTEIALLMKERSGTWHDPQIVALIPDVMEKQRFDSN